MATMNVNLPADMVDFVEREVAAGGYSSVSDVVGDAIRLLRNDKARAHEKLEILRHEVGVGLNDADDGRFSSQSVSEIAAVVRRDSIGG